MAELEATISVREYLQWAAYYRIEPWGEDRADLRIAKLCALIKAIVTGKSVKAAEFIEEFDKPPQTTDEMGKIFGMFAEAHNEALRRRG